MLHKTHQTAKQNLGQFGCVPISNWEWGTFISSIRVMFAPSITSPGQMMAQGLQQGRSRLWHSSSSLTWPETCDKVTWCNVYHMYHRVSMAMFHVDLKLKFAVLNWSSSAVATDTTLVFQPLRGSRWKLVSTNSQARNLHPRFTKTGGFLAKEIIGDTVCCWCAVPALFFFICLEHAASQHNPTYMFR